ncbi:hypothetical protein B0537_02220 [Desulforamulus ferrireducens]|uniref:Uncharacterized protein n=1 Tax=Desulforamulus ferrireducens TaxID=1833852 RepID=A0A1S6ITC2_9FIRM|nr:hypothetical protein B0537_02220 [Desulforamulus ferrireducens]
MQKALNGKIVWKQGHREPGLVEAGVAVSLFSPGSCPRESVFTGNWGRVLLEPVIKNCTVQQAVFVHEWLPFGSKQGGTAEG